MLMKDFVCVQDWSYVYRPPPMWKVANSNKYAPLPILPSQTMTALFLPPPYRPSLTMNPPTGSQSSTGSVLENSRSLALIRPFNRIPMVPPVPHFPRGVPPAPFSPISPSPYLEGSSFGSHMGRAGSMGPMGFPSHMNPSSNTLKQLLQHQQVHHHHHHHQQMQHQQQFQHQSQFAMQQHQQHQQHQQQQQQPNLPECHSLMLNIILGHYCIAISEPLS